MFASTIQLRIASAAEFALPSEDPLDCIKVSRIPCAVSTGNDPRMFSWHGDSYELDRNIVMRTEKKKFWTVYQGMLVVNGEGPLQIHTPFAEIYLGKSKAMIHVLKNKVRILSLAGAGIRVKAKGDASEHFLVPGFQNWYGGVDQGQSESGVVSVIDLQQYSKQRAQFFMDHMLGFPKELELVASHIKWAAKISSQLHEQLVERKVASLEEKHQKKVRKKYQKIKFNKFLRELFLKKMRYDD